MKPGLVLPLVVILLPGCEGVGDGPRSPDTGSRLRAATAAEASGQMDVALSMYAAAALAAPGNADAQARFARALLRAGNGGQAEQVLSAAVQRRPNDPALLMELGRLRLQAGAAEAALGYFDRVLAASPRDVDALDLRGVALDLMGRHGEAQQSYRQALALRPASLSVANNLGLSLLLSGQAAEAVAVLEPLVRRADATDRVRANDQAALAAAAPPAQVQ